MPESKKQIENIAKLLNRPLAIGNKKIPNRLVMAPMSKLGHVALRKLISEFGGCGLMFSEMAGAKAFQNKNPVFPSGIMWTKEEFPRLVCQIFGSTPEEMAIAAEKIEDMGFFGVDLNFGCSVASLCKLHCGAAILKNPPLAEKIIMAVRKAISIPLFVKFRTGWKDDPKVPVELAKRLEGAGADALTFHPRVAPDKRTRPPNWEYIGKVKKSVSIPVFGNGNVFSFQDCLKMLRTTGCDGVSIGRLAVARPFVFAAWTKGFEPDLSVYRYTALSLTELLLEYFDPVVALRRFYKFSPYFAANFRFGHTFFSYVHKAKDIETLKKNIEFFFDMRPEIIKKPSVALFK